MKRYHNTSTRKRWDGKNVFNTTHYPSIPIQDSDLYVVSNETDSLDTLSFKYYNDPTLWWVIALANNIGRGRMSVEAGLQLRIPVDIQRIISEFDRMNG